MAGINIDSDDASKENIPEDLNSLAYSAYRIPNIIRRRLITYVLFALLILVFVLDMIFPWLIFKYTYLLLLIIAIYSLIIESKISIQQSDVIELVGQYIKHSIGYYSVALTFKGYRLTPIWTCIIYDHTNPPRQKSIIEIDANTGELSGKVFTENLL